MPSEFICAKCGATVSKRKSRLVGGGRICKEHEEAQEFAEKDQKAKVEKANRDREKATRNMDSFRSSRRLGDSMRQLSAFAVLGRMFREHQQAKEEREVEANEMLKCGFKSKAYAIFFNALNKDSGGCTQPEMIAAEFDAFKVELMATGRNETMCNRIGECWDAAVDGFIDALFKRMYVDDIVNEANAIIEEWKATDARHDELLKKLYPYTNMEESLDDGMLERDEYKAHWDHPGEQPPTTTPEETNAN